MEKTFYDNSFFKKKVMTLGSDEKVVIKHLLEILTSTQKGKLLVHSANKKLKENNLKFGDLIGFGQTSFTDTKLLRKFSLKNPEKVEYNLKSNIVISRDSTVLQASLDLAHELTHYVYREDFNPYHKEFNKVDFIKNSIEGEAGEVHAFLNECEVLKDISRKLFLSNSRCREIYSVHKESRKKHAIELFYQLGNFYHFFEDKVGEKLPSFPYVNPKKPFVFSAVHSMPYPVAIFKEYEMIQSAVCQNDSVRISIIKENIDRSPASENTIAMLNDIKNHEEHCESIN